MVTFPLDTLGNVIAEVGNKDKIYDSVGVVKQVVKNSGNNARNKH